MRRYRKNADERRRQLERAASEGDPQARRRLTEHLLRTGNATVQWILEAGPNAVLSLPADVREELVGVLAAVMLSVPVRESPLPGGGWFPRHNRYDVCPRGHLIEERMLNERTVNNFTYAELVSRYSMALKPDDEDGFGPEDGVVIDDWRGEEEEIEAVILCNVCGATWPPEVIE